MITGLTPIATEVASASTNIAGNQSLGKDAFLQLLVAQLQAQDPLDPQSAEDFSAQLAQFSSLEQMTNVNANLEQIQKFEQAVNNSSLVNLIGKNIDAPGNVINLNPGETESLNFSLSEDAEQVEVEIFDSTGQKVTTLTIAGQTAGNSQAVWNGTDGQGKPVDPGVYTFQVKAQKANGDEVAAQTFISGKITDVVFEEDGANAIINGQKISVSEISRVSI
ncbi:MAG: basal-body rod modification protein FlgD [Nitrospinaceae bacterium]|nr:MAG: basal-body rod modification protein FlgD [Nitrospinaceae bacterium]